MFTDSKSCIIEYTYQKREKETVGPFILAEKSGTLITDFSSRCICRAKADYGRYMLPIHILNAGYMLQTRKQLRLHTCRSWSARTIATIASTIGTALGTTHGSWRPLALKFTSCPSLLTVLWFCEMVEVGLKAILITMSSPFDNPPCTPPDLQIMTSNDFLSVNKHCDKMQKKERKIENQAAFMVVPCLIHSLLDQQSAPWLHPCSIHQFKVAPSEIDSTPKHWHIGAFWRIHGTEWFSCHNKLHKHSQKLLLGHVWKLSAKQGELKMGIVGPFGILFYRNSDKKRFKPSILLHHAWFLADWTNNLHWGYIHRVFSNALERKGGDFEEWTKFFFHPERNPYFNCPQSSEGRAACKHRCLNILPMQYRDWDWPVCFGTDLTILHVEGVIVFTAQHRRARKAAANLKSLQHEH